MPLTRIKKFSVTNFPLTPEQREEFRESLTIEVRLYKLHALLNIYSGKVYRAHIYGSDRSPITVTVTKIAKKGGSTFVTLERKRDE